MRMNARLFWTVSMLTILPWGPAACSSDNQVGVSGNLVGDLQAATQRALDAYSKADYQGFSSLTCGRLKQDLERSDREKFQTEARADSQARGRVTVSDLRSVTQTNETKATVNGVLRYEKIPSPIPVHFSLEKSDSTWRLCSYSTMA